MTEQQMRALRATMPWREFNSSQGSHTLIKIIDRNGNEVPLLTLVAFSIHMSALLTRNSNKGEKDAQVPEAQQKAGG